MKIALHKFQKQAIFSDKRIIAMIAGLQSGKTFAGSIWLRMMISRFKAKDDAFIVAFPTYKLYNSSTLPAFMRLHKDLGDLNKSEYIFTCKHGPRVYFRSMDNDWSAEGITNTRAIWIDEGGLISTQAFINLMGRASTKQAPIFISTTPYVLNNYLFRDLYEPWRAGERADVDIIQFRSIDNPHFPKEEYERQKRLLDPRMFAMRYEGQFERMAGLVYQDFDYANYVDPFRVEQRFYRVFGGLDWGYTDPFGIVVRAISRDGQHDYQIAEYKRSGHTPDEQLSIAKQYQSQYGVEMFFADSADPGMISMFQKGGIRVKGVEDKNLEFGIAQHLALIRSKVYQVFRGRCPETEYEYESYQYKDFDMDKPGTAKPLDINNHLMDANRYLTVETIHVREEGFKPFVPNKTHLQELLSGRYATVKADEEEW
jgi:PBSX family phage terminase large subunit